MGGPWSGEAPRHNSHTSNCRMLVKPLTDSEEEGHDNQEAHQKYETMQCFAVSQPKSLKEDEGKIIPLDTSAMRAAMKPDWEDVVRRCIQRFYAQHEGEMSFAKRHHQEVLSLEFVLSRVYQFSLSDGTEASAQTKSKLIHFQSAGEPDFVISLHMVDRYWFALKYGYQAAFKSNNSEDALIDGDGSTNIIHKGAIDAMTDISMLRLFKAFLESTPQLILQIYILMTSDKFTFSQYASITMSFFSITCSTVDYQIALRKSLPEKKKFAGIPSRIIYLSYKLMTLTSWILSIALITVLSAKYSIILLVFLWLGGISWVLKQHTTFCKSKTTEIAYRVIVGIILIFTFFNVKGEKTKVPLAVYYVIRACITIAILCACMYWESFFNAKIHLPLLIIAVGLALVMGIIFLIVYYGFFHPSIYCTQDVVDGPTSERQDCRIRKFLNQ